MIVYEPTEIYDPDEPGRLTVVFVRRLSCPACESLEHAAYKTRTRHGVQQQFRRCRACGKRFRLDFEGGTGNGHP